MRMVLLEILAAFSSGLAVQVYGYSETRPLALQIPEIYDSRLNIPDPFFGDNVQVIVVNKSNLVKRQQRTCDPGYVPCSDGIHCAQIGDYCCSNGDGTCRTGTSCCLGQPVCARSGYSCCANGPYTCPTGGSCCSQGEYNCAPPGGSCCGVGYCRVGETCCGAGCASAGRVCCGNRASCPSGSKCCEDEDGDKYCAAECVPSLIFPYVKGLLDEIYENMCRGTAKSSRTDDPHTDIVTLESQTGSALRRIKATRRRDALCTGSKRIKCPPGYSCDEFPFASTSEGGSNAQVMCVPRWQNDWQGTYFGSWLSEVLNSGKLKRGGQFRIKMKYIDCSQFTKRQQIPSDVMLGRDGNVTVLSSAVYGNYSSGKNAVLIPLTVGGSHSGRFTVNYSLSAGNIESGGVVDEDGELLSNISAIGSGTSNSVSLELEDDFGDLTLIGWTKDREVHVQYAVQSTPLSGSRSAAYRQSLSLRTVVVAALVGCAMRAII